MARSRFLKKILGVLLALGGAIILIELVPTLVWYFILGGLCLLFFLVLFKII